MRARIVPAADPASLDEAVRVLRAGGLVCYPTDTVYGIGAVAGDDGAVRRLFEAKGRSLDKPLPLLLADPADAARIAEVTPLAEALADRFWPGALTIVMRKLPSYRTLAVAGAATVALRVPDHDLARGIVRALSGPMTGSSANRAGASAPLTAAGAMAQMGELADLVIDGGRSPAGKESTIVDITTDPPEVLRAGAVGEGEVEEALGRTVLVRASATRS